MNTDEKEFHAWIDRELTKMENSENIPIPVAITVILIALIVIPIVFLGAG